MAQLKRWESPRREGRNSKGKGGSARQRQLKKRTQMLRKKLQQNQGSDEQKDSNQQRSKQQASKTAKREWINHSFFVGKHAHFSITVVTLLLRLNSGDCFRMGNDDLGQKL